MKLYLVTRADLTVGQQAVQAAHAALEYADWLGEHPPFVLLVARDEEHLDQLAVEVELQADPLAVVRFREPDLEYALTAFAAMGKGVDRVLRGLPLMGSQ